jgi:hypothetical protein
MTLNIFIYRTILRAVLIIHAIPFNRHTKCLNQSSRRILECGLENGIGVRVKLTLRDIKFPNKRNEKNERKKKRNCEYK